MLEWLSGSSFYGWKAPGVLTESLGRMLPSVVPFTIEHPPSPDAFLALVPLATWASRDNQPLAGLIGSVLAGSIDRVVERSTRKLLMIALSTGTVNAGGSIAPSQWAKRALEEHGSELLAHERVQLLVNASRNDDKQLLESEEALLDAIAEH